MYIYYYLSVFFTLMITGFEKYRYVNYKLNKLKPI